jgi:hypothetical protein
MEKKSEIYQKTTFGKLNIGDFFKKFGDSSQTVYRKKRQGYGRDIFLRLDIPFKTETSVIVIKF